MTAPMQQRDALSRGTTGFPVLVVIVTRNRRASLLAALGHLTLLPEAPGIVVVDNGSEDGTAESVRERYPDVEVIALRENRGSAGRTAGIRRVVTPYVAFADDDSWWAPGALALAAEIFARFPRLAMIAGRVLLDDEGREDPTCALMAASPVRSPRPLPGPAVLGFIACGAVVRRSAYLEAGGFHPRFGIGGEEELLALDLAARGWDLAYVPEIVAHHHPSPSRDPERRRQIITRNALWCAWLRRPLAPAIGVTLKVVQQARREPAARAGLWEAARGLPWVLRERAVIPRRVEREVRRLEQDHEEAAR